MDNTMKIGIVVLAVIALIYMVSNYSKKHREGFVDLDQDEGFTDGGDELAEEHEGPEEANLLGEESEALSENFTDNAGNQHPKDCFPKDQLRLGVF